MGRVVMVEPRSIPLHSLVPLLFLLLRFAASVLPLWLVLLELAARSKMVVTTKMMNESVWRLQIHSNRENGGRWGCLPPPCHRRRHSRHYQQPHAVMAPAGFAAPPAVWSAGCQRICG